MLKSSLTSVIKNNKMLIVFDCSFDLGVGIFSSVIAYLYAARTNNTAFKVMVFTVFTLS